MSSVHTETPEDTGHEKPKSSSALKRICQVVGLSLGTLLVHENGGYREYLEQPGAKEGFIRYVLSDARESVKSGASSLLKKIDTAEENTIKK